MKNIEHWMLETSPLSPRLSRQEQASLKSRVLEKSRPRKRPIKLVLILAAAMCLLAACGVMLLGLFDTMTPMNRTTKMAEEYGLILEDSPSMTVDGHTVTVEAIIRSEHTVRILFNISGTRRQTLDYRFFQDENGASIPRLQILNNHQATGYTGQPPDVSRGEYNLVNRSGMVGKADESGAYRYFADAKLPSGATDLSLYVLSEAGGAEVTKLTLPKAIADKDVAMTDVTIHFELAADNAVDCTVEQLKITPFGLVLQGKYTGQMQTYPAEHMDWSANIRLYDKNGTEIFVGKDGLFFGESSGIGPDESPVFSIELASYDLIDPAAVFEVEINGVRYPTT